jgi:hypothetical protein
MNQQWKMLEERACPAEGVARTQVLGEQKNPYVGHQGSFTKHGHGAIYQNFCNELS